MFLTMGTKKILFEEVKKEIQSLHNYEVPAIVMYDIIDGNSRYFKNGWKKKTRT